MPHGYRDHTATHLPRPYGPHHCPLFHSQRICPAVNESTSTAPVSPLGVLLWCGDRDGYSADDVGLLRKQHGRPTPLGPYIQMALHTTFGFVLVGVGILAFAWVDNRAQHTDTPTLLPILVGIGVLTATLCAWEALWAQERAYIWQIIQAETASDGSIRSALDTGVEAQILGLQRIAKRWENTGPPAQENWASEALLNVQDFQGYQGMGGSTPPSM